MGRIITLESDGEAQLVPVQMEKIMEAGILKENIQLELTVKIIVVNIGHLKWAVPVVELLRLVSATTPATATSTSDGSNNVSLRSVICMFTQVSLLWVLFQMIQTATITNMDGVTIQRKIRLWKNIR